MHEIWCLGSDGIACEVHPIARVDVSARVVGQFLPDYLAKNGCRIPILSQIFINGSVEILDTPNFSVDPCLLRISWIPMIQQVGETVVTPFRTGPFSRGGAYIKVSVPWRDAIPAHPA